MGGGATGRGDSVVGLGFEPSPSPSAPVHSRSPDWAFCKVKKETSEIWSHLVPYRPYPTPHNPQPNPHPPLTPAPLADRPVQVEFVVAFLGTTLARAVAAPLNQNYRQVGTGRPWGTAGGASGCWRGPGGRSAGGEGHGQKPRRAKWPWCGAQVACGRSRVPQSQAQRDNHCSSCFDVNPLPALPLPVPQDEFKFYMEVGADPSTASVGSHPVASGEHCVGPLTWRTPRLCLPIPTCTWCRPHP